MAAGCLRSGRCLAAGTWPIPARAGEPRPTCLPVPARRAYPRSRGGTGSMSGSSFSCRGLSPLARGNHQRYAVAWPSLGPIPARAGEPPFNRLSTSKCWAYPRSRGGTMPTNCSDAGIAGLSPLARGNPGISDSRTFSIGPIPARAGEPRAGRQRRWSMGAYPRSRGGTDVRRQNGGAAEGLSPLARGNLSGQHLRAMRKGPIPARAGEPRRPSISQAPTRAYPRSRGGTMMCSMPAEAGGGLSPLARGNLNPGPHEHLGDGPIPARAGEPAL